MYDFDCDRCRNQVMSGVIYEWMKNLAVFYIFLTVVMNLVPDERYGEHIRFFMGLILILLVASPLLQMLQLKDTVTELFRQNTWKEEYLDAALENMQTQLEKQQEEIQKRLEEKYWEEQDLQ